MPKLMVASTTASFTCILCGTSYQVIFELWAAEVIHPLLLLKHSA